MKTILRNSSTITTGLVAFLLLPIAFSSFFFFISSQFAPVFGEQGQSSVGRVHIYSLIQRHSIASTEIHSILIVGQRNASSTKLIEVPGLRVTQKPRIKINELILAPACGVKTQGRSGNPICIPIQAHENEIDVAGRTGRDNVKQNIYAAFDLPKIRQNSRVSLSTKKSAGENPSGGEKKLEGAGGFLGDFFEGGFSTPSKGAYRIEVTPRISIRGEYDDNILLLNTNPVADYKTIVSPGIKISASSDTNGLDLDYEFGWVKYHKRTQNDFTQHAGNLRFWQQVARHLTFTLEDSYLKSNDYLGAINQIPVTQRIANTLQAYQRNDARAALDYQFGPKSHFILGHIYNILDNDGPALEDAREYGPFARLSYWFTQKDGLDFSYENLRYIYDQPDYIYNWRDLNAQNIRGSYMHHFDGRTSASVHYGLSIRKSLDFPIQYKIHDVGAGLSHAFSQDLSVGVGLGYYKPTGDVSLNSGVSSLFSIKKAFERGSIEIRGETGWDQGFLDVVPRGFTRFSGASGTLDYKLMENVNIFANGSYRKNRYANDQINELLNQATEDETYQGICGINWRPYRWFTLRLDYMYTNRTSPDPRDEFVDNRIGLILTADKPFKW